MINNKKVLSLLIVLFGPLGFMSLSHAEIFKCTNEQGKVFYNDKPCPVTDKEKKIMAEKDVENGYVPPEFKPASDIIARKGLVIGGIPLTEFKEMPEPEDTGKKENLVSNMNKTDGNVNQSNNDGSPSAFKQDGKPETDEAEEAWVRKNKNKARKKTLSPKEKRIILNVKLPHL